ncbi:glycosyltransferase family 2 protein [Stieleria varia]|uniref:Chondroitin synthase n=1 Tax=Stieleria varia TaxID=2528005 RepID=A0A5C6AE58_9BACT|nr:glycosyltransferase family 2 protein [Stieleria varia]TWT98264.1 Chondroitin synthase [Stieleria varia]
MTDDQTNDRKPRRISVVLSTYNAPAWLEKSLWGYAMQTYHDFELIIADDGSRSETRDMIERIREQTQMLIRHVWHLDDGFRKCTILNEAIRAAKGDYLVFSDGDCIPRPDFLAQHHAAACPGRFLSGGYYKLPMSVSEAISVDDIRSGRAFSVSFLRSSGLPFSPRWLRLNARGIWADFLNRVTTTKPTWNGNNASGWTTDIVAAGGFDERMRYGGEDRELGERLENAGIRGKHVRYQTVCLHLDHARGYVNDADLRRNREIRDETQRTGRTRTEHGLQVSAERSQKVA